jgi:hypothetical protein
MPLRRGYDSLSYQCKSVGVPNFTLEGLFRALAVRITARELKRLLVWTWTVTVLTWLVAAVLLFVALNRAP